MLLLLIIVSILIILGLALIVPINIVSKWQSRPTLALLSALIACVLTMCLIYLLLEQQIAGPFDYGLIWRGLSVMIFTSIVLGLPILLRVQSKKRKN